MKRALINLVDNAVAALGEEEGEIVISTRFLPATVQVVLEIADTGPGFPPEDRDRAFLPYYSTKRSSGGLGLAIVNRIVVEHGGEVRIEDNQPRGARLVITLPVAGPGRGMIRIWYWHSGNQAIRQVGPGDSPFRVAELPSRQLTKLPFQM